MFIGLLVYPFPHCCFSVAKSCPTLCDAVDCGVQGFSVLHYLLEFVQIHVPESVMPSTHLILCCPLLLLSSISRHQGLSNESALRIRWPMYWSFSISPSNGYSGLISFGIDWFDLLAVQGTLKNFHIGLGGLDGKESACSAGDLGLIPGSGRSPGERNGNPLQYSCLDNSMDRRAWWDTVHGVTRSWT